jgi:hypothetical protein
MVFGAETAAHTLRLILSGLFDRFPRLRIILGHLGEGLSFLLPLSKAAAWFARETNTIPPKGSGSWAITRHPIRSPPCAGCRVSPPAATMHGRRDRGRGGQRQTRPS